MKRCVASLGLACFLVVVSTGCWLGVTVRFVGELPAGIDPLSRVFENAKG